MSGGFQTDLGSGNQTWPGAGDNNTGDNTVFGNAGNDFIDGGAGNDSLDGGNDNDLLVANIGNDTLDGGSGIDAAIFYEDIATGVTISLAEAGSQAIGTDGSVRLSNIENVFGTDFADLLTGDTGANTLAGAYGVTSSTQTSGNDTLVGGGGADSLHGGGDNDSLLGSVDATLSGGMGDDTLSGGGWLLGGFGNDRLVEGSAVRDDPISVSGGEGDDTLEGGGAGANLSGGNGHDSILGNTNARLTGGSGSDTLVAGNSVQNGILDGGNDADSLLGGNNVDSLAGGQGNDTLDGGAGDDTLTGGAGNDFASYATANDTIEAFLSNNETTGGVAEGAGGSDRLFGIEGLIGGNSSDTLSGNSAVNTLMGGDGNDSLVGGGGNDLLDYGAGNDEFVFRSGFHTDDLTLMGGAGDNDYLNLGSGWISGPVTNNDWINFQRLDNVNNDTIVMYTQGWERVVCFAEGTRIVTPNGEDAVENLRAGDMVLAMRDGQAGFEALRWVGFMDVAVPRNAAMAAKTAPILIKAGAIAPGMPARDLRVSPDHAMEVDGHLIPAKHLVNGESIIQEVWCKRVRYFHLELEAHGLLLSEGTWSESYLDDGNRDAFNNTAMTGLFLDFEAGRSKGQYDDQACLPVLRQGLKLDEIHGRIALRAAELAQPAKGRRWG
jgi:Ca2+-binding RTX toxin-like protein